jgi:hypothetical protein
MTEEGRREALRWLAAIALSGLAATVFLLWSGAPAEAALAVFGVTNLAAGAIAGAFTLGGPP